MSYDAKGGVDSRGKRDMEASRYKRGSNCSAATSAGLTQTCTIRTQMKKFSFSSKTAVQISR